jgi:hypothetical protein
MYDCGLRTGEAVSLEIPAITLALRGGSALYVEGGSKLDNRSIKLGVSLPPVKQPHDDWSFSVGRGRVITPVRLNDRLTIGYPQ